MLRWARTWPPASPLLGGRGAQWKYLKKGEEPLGLFFQPGKKKGSVAVYLQQKGAKVHINAGTDDKKEALLASIEAWTLPWGSGHPPTQAVANLPPY